MPKPDLSPRQRQFVTALVSCPTVRTAARTVGISERHAYRLLADPRIQAALAEVQDQALAEATRQAVRAMSKALTALMAIANDADLPPGPRVSAARALCEIGLKLTEVNDLARRVETLERRWANENQSET